MEFDLPYPPSLNTYYRHVGNKVLISAKGRDYRTNVMACLQLRKKLMAPEGRLCLTINVHPPDARRRDLDNVQKAVLDALMHSGIYEDDSLIDRIIITRKEIIRPHGLLRIVITKWEESNEHEKDR